MRASTERHLNDDLLLTEEDRKLAASSFPAIVHVLDFPNLRDLFAAYEAPANRSKSLLHQGGLATIILGVIALVGASTEPLYGTLPPTVAAALIVVSATAGLFSIIFGAFGVFSSSSKARWLEDRLMAERLRQFQFQMLVFHIPTIVGDAATAELKDQFFKARDRWLAKFQLEYKGHLSAKLKEILDDDADEQSALHDSDAGTRGRRAGSGRPIFRLQAAQNSISIAVRKLQIEHRKSSSPAQTGFVAERDKPSLHIDGLFRAFCHLGLLRERADILYVS
jgi:hypothetical protein